MEITISGYLYLDANLAASHFPNDAVITTVEAGNLLLWPTSGSFAGGLLLKQRNPAGDRAVLLSEVLPSGTTPGAREAHWNEQRLHLSIPLLVPAVGANTVIEQQNGRYVVYLEVGFWEDGLKVTRQRINDYPTRRDAEVAASWILRSAERGS